MKRVLLIVAVAVAAQGFAHEYTSLPLLVNFHAFPNDPDEDSDYSFAKERFEKNVADANRILNKAARNLGQDGRLRLGPITIQRNPQGAQTVQQGTAAARTMVKDGLKELKTKQKNKGLKVYIVSSVKSSAGAEIPGLGDQGTTEKPSRVSWFPDGTFNVVPGAGGLEGNSGQFLLHEIGHNAGLSPNHDPANNGVGFMKAGLDHLPDDRAINAAQWAELAKLFRKYGATHPNEDQQGAFVPPSTESHFALDADPALDLVRPLGWVALAIDDDGVLTAELAWQNALGLAEAASYSIPIGLNLDDDLGTDSFPSYGPGLEAVVDLWLEHSPGGPFSVGGYLAYYDPSYQYVPLESVGFFDLGLTGADGDFEIDRSAIQLHHDISVVGAPAAVVPAIVWVHEDGNPHSYDTDVIEAPQATLLSLPLTLADAGTITVAGAGFAPNQDVEIFLDHVTEASLLPVVSGVTFSGGGFSLQLTVNGVLGGDYVVTARDSTGIIASGIVTLIGGIFEDGFEDGSTDQWSTVW